MQIVIDIPEKKYKSICDHFMFMHENEVMFSVKEGIPLNDVLDKIRSEIDRQEKWLLHAGCTACNVDIALDAIKSAVGRGVVE